MTDPHDLADELAAARADNARLRRLLDEAGLHDGLRHAFRDTLAMLRAILRRSAETAGDVEGYVDHLEGRLDAIGRVRSSIDLSGEVDLHALVSNELLAHLVHEGERATISGPDVRLRPKAAQVLALAVHELVSNAVEHGSLDGGDGRVAVAWHVEGDPAEPFLAMTWKETGGAGVTEPARRGFGTAVLEQMLAHEMDGRTALTFEPDGLRCVLRLPLVGRVARLASADGGVDGGAAGGQVDRDG